MEIEFNHKIAAHCENGVIANMLRFYGFDVSEPMIFGLSYGLFFSHMPFVKLAGQAVTSFRTFPGVLFSRVTKLLGFKTETERFLNEEKAMAKVNKLVDAGVPVGCVVGMYYLPYMPLEYRFPFNGHNICVVGHDTESNVYTVSDPNCTEKVKITAKDLQKVRFTKGGTYPLFGQMYWVKEAPKELPDMAELAVKAIKKNCWYMTSQPSWLPFFGVNGIDYLGRKMALWEDKLGKRKAALGLAQIIRMLEEIGTGGAGFRFMYGAFLQEVAKLTGEEEYKTYSKRITEIGDKWRSFAAEAAGVFKRKQGSKSYPELASLISEIGQMERKFFTDLAAFNKNVMKQKNYK